jgi:DNA repair exonuclease SbcCD ATPase subunit
MEEEPMEEEPMEEAGPESQPPETPAFALVPDEPEEVTDPALLTEAGADADEVAAQLRALREEASRADEAGASILRRLQELETVEARVEDLEQELTVARQRIEDLESRSSGAGVALADVREATEMLGQLRRTLEAGAGRGDDES